MKIAIIGGGIIGLSSAYYLNKAGCDVSVIDQGAMNDGCSFGNAGMIVPSHIIPLAAPGMIGKGLKWMFDASSPFYINPRFSRDLLSWGFHFYRSATSQNVLRAVPALKELSLLSKLLYRRWSTDLPFDFGYKEKGLLMLYKTASMEHEEGQTARLANRNGIEARVLSRQEAQNIESEMRLDVRGGIYYPGDAQLIPQQLMNGIISYLKTKGVKFYSNVTITDFVIEGISARVLHAGDSNFEFDQLVVATGAWSGTLCSKLRISLPMQAGKGYSFTLPDIPINSSVPSIFLEARVAVTPMGTSIRFGGTMEITGIDHSISLSRVKGIVDSIQGYYPDMKVTMPAADKIWHGLRPCSPDGLPYIGRSKKIKNVIIATGHAMMGMSLGPATGKLVAEIATGSDTSMDIDIFDPERFGL